MTRSAQGDLHVPVYADAQQAPALLLRELVDDFLWSGVPLSHGRFWTRLQQDSSTQAPDPEGTFAQKLNAAQDHQRPAGAEERGRATLLATSSPPQQRKPKRKRREWNAIAKSKCKKCTTK